MRVTLLKESVEKLITDIIRRKYRKYFSPVLARHRIKRDNSILQL
jgi:hypothetical protein